MEIKTKRMLSIVFSVLGSLGTLGTIYSTRKAAKKEIDILNKMSEEQLSWHVHA